MAIIFGILILVGIISLYGEYTKTQKGKDTLMGCFVLVGIVVVLLIGAAMCGGHSKPTPVNTPAPIAKPTQHYLFDNAFEFEGKFNQYCSTYQTEFRINKLNIIEGPVQNTFAYSLTDNLALNGTIDKDNGGVKEVFMIGMGNGEVQSGTNMVVCMLAIIATADPSIPDDKRVSILKELHFGDKNYDVTNMETATYRNNIKYYIISSPQMGFWFGATTE